MTFVSRAAVAAIHLLVLTSPCLGGAIGHPNQPGARLTESVRLARTGKGYYQKGFKGGRNYGTPELVRLIEEAGRRWHSTRPEMPFHVGDLSTVKGGKIHPHSSHRNGLDADIQFLFTDSNEFKTENNAELLKAFIEAADASDGDVSIHTIFVGCKVKQRLCRWAKEADRFEEFTATLATLEPHRGHSSHFHVRLNCPAEDSRCRLSVRTRGENVGCPDSCPR